jgi:hypothetical protein
MGLSATHPQDISVEFEELQRGAFSMFARCSAIRLFYSRSKEIQSLD